MALQSGFAVDGEINGKRVPEGTCFLLSKDVITKEERLYSGDFGNIYLKDNVASLDVVSAPNETGGGVQGAAGGAVLGFLIAGPVGTVLGAGLGSKKSGSDKTIIAMTFFSGEQLILRMWSKKDAPLLEKLKNYHISSSFSKANKLENKEKKGGKGASQLKIGKPKKPKWLFELEVIKGRKISDKSKLPDFPYLLKWESLEGNEKAIKVFNKNLRKEVQNYNNFKWAYFDQVIESENEIDLLAKSVLDNLIALSNQFKNSKDNIVQLEKNIKNLENDLKESNSALKAAEKDLLEAGFLKKGGIKKQIKNIEADIYHTKNLTSKNKRSITNKKKKFDSLKEMKSIEDPASEFVSIFGKVLPNSQKPKKNLKARKTIDTQFYLDTYKKVFDEVWDKRIKEEAKEKESNKPGSNNVTKSPPSSMKEKLLELKGLLDEQLISEKEYETARKKILGNL